MLKVLNSARMASQKMNYFSNKIIKTVEGHKAPQQEDTIQGRYAAVTFSGASKAESLDKVNEDMQNLKQMVDSSETFRQFLANVSLKRGQQTQVLDTLSPNLNFTTVQLISTIFIQDTLIENKRLDSLPQIINKFIDYYKILNKEENIRIISASELSKEDQKRVSDALKQANKNVNFTIKYEVKSKARLTLLQWEACKCTAGINLWTALFSPEYKEYKVNCKNYLSELFQMDSYFTAMALLGLRDQNLPPYKSFLQFQRSPISKILIDKKDDRSYIAEWDDDMNYPVVQYPKFVWQGAAFGFNLFFYAYNYNNYTANIRLRSMRYLFPFVNMGLFFYIYMDYKEQLLKVNLFDEYVQLRSKELVEQHEFLLQHQDFKRFIWWFEDFKETLSRVHRQANNHESTDFKDSELILQDFIRRYSNTLNLALTQQ